MAFRIRTAKGVVLVALALHVPHEQGGDGAAASAAGHWFRHEHRVQISKMSIAVRVISSLQHKSNGRVRRCVDFANNVVGKLFALLARASNASDISPELAMAAGRIPPDG